MGNYIFIIIIGVISIVSYLTTFLVKKTAKHVGAIDVPNKRSKHTMHNTLIPRMGGLGLFFSMLMGCMLFGDVSVEMVAIILGSCVIIFAGIIDDIKPIKAVYKLIFQIIGSLIIVLYGKIYFTGFSVFGCYIEMHDYIAQCVSLFFIVSIINAINLIDGIDGLATGISLIYFITIGLIGFIVNKVTGIDIKLTFTMIGATLGFLIHNFPPAKIFLGDTGSMFLGLIIAVVALLGLRDGTLPSVIVPVVILGIPVLDTLFAILRRIIKNRKITSADKDHFHHQILKLDLPLYISVLIFYGISILFSLTAIFFTTRSLIPFIVLAVILLAILVFVVSKTNVLYDKKNKAKKANKTKKEEVPKAKKISRQY